MTRKRPIIMRKEEFDKTKKNVKRTAKIFVKKTSGNIGRVAAYVWKTTRNSIKDRPKTRRKGRPLVIYSVDGKYLGLASDFLKGSFRAYGAGSFNKKQFYSTNRFVTSGRLAKRNQRANTYVRKGTGKFDAQEREDIAAFRDRPKRQRAILREIRRAEKKAAQAERRSKYKTWSEEERTSAAAEATSARKKAAQLRRAYKKTGNAQRKHKYRIVKRHRGEVAARDFQTHDMIPKRSKPGEPPKTTPPGSVLRRAIFFEQTSATSWRIMAASDKRGNAIFRTLETGGTSLSGRKSRFREHGDMIGYAIAEEQDSTQRKDGRTQTFSHKRVSLVKKYEKKRRTIRFAARPFFKPARERAVERLSDILGQDASKMVNGKFF
ncbi:MAG: hypothetical protein Q4D38_13960 [Planctomycetia bacterium]|nr:hypothetical protein [Planctomycetia bacterium]